MDQENYPTNFEEFLEWFQTKEDCLEYISMIRWPHGFLCPQCQSIKAWKMDRGLMSLGSRVLNDDRTIIT